MERESTETKSRMREVQISHSPVGSSLLAIPAQVPEAPECAIWDIPAQLGPKRTAAFFFFFINILLVIYLFGCARSLLQLAGSLVAARGLLN